MESYDPKNTAGACVPDLDSEAATAVPPPAAAEVSVSTSGSNAQLEKCFGRSQPSTRFKPWEKQKAV
uniref:Uncharacterized protein n=1 Tax=Oryza punctata TaxID=4537 RepID=A0A0E0MCX0_ORYPU